MALEFVLLALGVCQVAAGLKTIPCWKQEDLQYFIYDKQVHIPTAVLGHDIYMRLARNGDNFYGLEVRKPIREPTQTHCHVFKASEKKNERLVRRLLASMDQVPEIISIKTIWPEAKVCVDAKLEKPKEAVDDVLYPIEPECTHAMILTYRQDSYHTIFRYNRTHLRGRRALIDKILSNFIEYFRTKDYLVAVNGPEPFRNEMQIFDRTWNSPALSIPAILDLAISTSFIDKGSSFMVTRTTKTTNIKFVRMASAHDEQWVGRHIDAFVFSFDRITSAASTLEFDVMEWMTGLFAGGRLRSANSNESPAIRGYKIMMEIPIGPDVQRLLYVYLYTILGIFYQKISEFIAQKCFPKKLFALEVETGMQYYKEMYDLFCQIPLDLSIELLPMVSFRNGAAGIPLTSVDFTKISAGLFPRPIVTSSNFYEFRETSDAGSDIFAVAHEFRSANDKAGWENTSYLNRSDYKFLGLPVSSNQQAKQTIRRMMAKLEREVLSALSDTDDTELLDSMSGSDDELEESSIDPLELFTKYSREVIQSQIAIEIIQHELSSIEKQCQECRALKDRQQRLVIFELFLKVKKLLSNKIPEGSNIFAQLDIKSSPLNIALKSTGIRDIFVVIKRAMDWLSSERLDHAHPDYNGEDLFYVKSKELRALFSKLLPHYQKANADVPEAAVLTEREFPAIPMDVSLAQAIAKKQEAEDLSSQLRGLMREFTEARRESKDCMSAYRDREYLLVGNIFKKCLDDLTLLAGPQAAATVSNHPVRVRMNQLGISEPSLSKMSSFMVQYRNPAAHPSADRYDKRSLDMDSGDDIQELVADFNFLRAKYDRIKKAFEV